MICDACQGDKVCPECDGTGIGDCPECGREGHKCDVCDGDGKCPDCGGTGKDEEAT